MPQLCLQVHSTASDDMMDAVMLRTVEPWTLLLVITLNTCGAGADQLFTVLLQLFTAGLGQACFKALILQLLLKLLKLLPADSALLQLTDAPSPGCQLNLYHHAVDACLYLMPF